MSNEQRAQDQQAQHQQAPTPSAQDQNQAQDQTAQTKDVDGLKDKKPEELTPEELRLMADTMPGEGPGD